jgi:hypothetical protein
LLGVAMYPGMLELTKEERLKYCDPEFYKLVKILMINDSLNYYVIWDKTGESAGFYDEFCKNNDFMVKEWLENHSENNNENIN